jgi:hypothetical protein
VQKLGQSSFDIATVRAVGSECVLERASPCQPLPSCKNIPVAISRGYRIETKPYASGKVLSNYFTLT